MGRHWRPVLQQPVRRSAGKLSSRSCSRPVARAAGRGAGQGCARAACSCSSSQPYLELHTGPGRGYPVTQVVARGESRGCAVSPHRLVQGAHRARHRGLGLGARAVARHRSPTARRSASTWATAPASARHRWEGGVFAGAYAGATLISAYRRAVDHRQSQDRGRRFAVPGQRLRRLPGRHRPGARVHARLALLAVRDPGHRLSSASSPRPCWRSPIDRSDQIGYVGVGAALLLDAALLPARRVPRVTSCSPRPTSMRSTKNGELGFAFFY